MYELAGRFGCTSVLALAAKQAGPISAMTAATQATAAGTRRDLLLKEATLVRVMA
jgi:hypothetical protein